MQLQSNYNPLDTCGCDIENTDAITMSKALIKCNYQWTDKLNTDLCDHRYVKQPSDLANMIKRQWGKPNYQFKNIVNQPENIKKKQGIIYLKNINNQNGMDHIGIYPNDHKQWKCQRLFLWTLK